MIYIFILVGLYAKLASCLYVMLSLRVGYAVVLSIFNCFSFCQPLMYLWFSQSFPPFVTGLSCVIIG
jgi:hypothetical protein